VERKYLRIMDYKRIYDNLIESRLLLKEERIKLRKKGEYFEAHHIVPKSMGGGGKEREYKHPNLVMLTAREHYIAHALLWLICGTYEMALAFKLMSKIKRDGKKIKHVVSSRMYEEVRLYLNNIDVSPETREKISKANSGKKRSPEHIEQMRQAQLGKKKSTETKEKIKRSNLLYRKLFPEHIEQMRQARLGKRRSSESKEKIRQAHLGKKLSPEHVEKIRQSHLGKKHSLECIEKMRKSNLGKRRSDEFKEKMRQVQLGKKQSPETIAKRIETCKRNRLLKLGQMESNGGQGG
jgi:hypothetical protein